MSINNLENNITYIFNRDNSEIVNSTFKYCQTYLRFSARVIKKNCALPH